MYTNAIFQHGATKYSVALCKSLTKTLLIKINKARKLSILFHFHPTVKQNSNKRIYKIYEPALFQIRKVKIRLIWNNKATILVCYLHNAILNLNQGVAVLFEFNIVKLNYYNG